MSCDAGPEWRFEAVKNELGQSWGDAPKQRIHWQKPGTFKNESKQLRRKSNKQRRAGELVGYEVHDGEQKDSPLAEQLGIQEGSYSIISTGATGAPNHRPRQGVTNDKLLAGLVWNAATNLPLDLVRRIAIVTDYHDQPRRSQERICRALWIAGACLMKNTNVAALASSFALSPSTAHRLRGEGLRIMETAAYLQDMERKLDTIASDVAEIIAMMRERYPNDAEVADEVDRFLASVSAQQS
jgi:hypothetical protein